MNSIDMDQIRELIKNRVPEKRFEHIRNVERTAVELARQYGVDVQKAALAALLHDAMRGLDHQSLLDLARKYGIAVDAYTRQHPGLLHGPLAACWAQSALGIHDEEVLSAVRAHTVGDDAMMPLTCILYLADAIEPSRDFPGVEQLRVAAKNNLYRATWLAIKESKKMLTEQGKMPHPISARAIDVLEETMKEANKQ